MISNDALQQESNEALLQDFYAEKNIFESASIPEENEENKALETKLANIPPMISNDALQQESNEALLQDFYAEKNIFERASIPEENEENKALEAKLANLPPMISNEDYRSLADKSWDSWLTNNVVDYYLK